MRVALNALMTLDAWLPCASRLGFAHNAWLCIAILVSLTPPHHDAPCIANLRGEAQALPEPRLCVVRIA